MLTALPKPGQCLLANPTRTRLFCATSSNYKAVSWVCPFALLEADTQRRATYARPIGVFRRHADDGREILPARTTPASANVLYL